MPLTCHVIYKDGTYLTLWQRDPDTGIEYSSEQIDREKLDTIIVSGAAGRPLLVQWLEPGQRLILRRRVERRIGVNPATGEEWPSVMVILLGWQRTIGGENVQHLSVIFENDEHVENICRYREDHPWFYSIQEVLADRQVIGESDQR
jgi:hypothetical protein